MYGLVPQLLLLQAHLRSPRIWLGLVGLTAAGASQVLWWSAFTVGFINAQSP